ncbi:7770_t:CDS:2 [Diversispora eburnea]|uniref:7770_t:CDS:1 n=1 Tax=Diversispora eburnea TaxID=1213867 RepID=A0A9N8UZP1_9GLOM|nr:7770_t:CDS:2 [Diversispora eburnea]
MEEQSITSDDKNFQNEKFSSSSIDASLVRPPFPPRITSSDLVSNKKNGDMPSRSPNAFMIYRKLFVDSLHNEGHYLSMTSASSLASASWGTERESVKAEYKRLADEAKSQHLKLFSNKIIRKKRNRKNRNTANQTTSWFNLIPKIPETPELNLENNFDFTAINLELYNQDLYYYNDNGNLLIQAQIYEQIQQQPDYYSNYSNYFNPWPFQ